MGFEDEHLMRQDLLSLMGDIEEPLFESSL